MYGIEFIETEESYTSQASFLDDDFLPKIGEKPESWKPKSFGHASRTGKRVKRGLYQTQSGLLINADANGSVNIIKKVSTKLGLNLSRVSSRDLTTLLRVRFWTAQLPPR